MCTKNRVKVKNSDADPQHVSGPAPVEVHSPVEFLKPEKQAGGMTAAARLRMRPPAAGFGNQKDMGGWWGDAPKAMFSLERRHFQVWLFFLFSIF